MGLRIIGLTVQKVRALLPAGAVVSSEACTDADTDCCGSVAPDCCDGGTVPATTSDFILVGPMGPDATTITLSGTAAQDGTTGLYYPAPQIAEEGAQVDFTLYCDGTGWHANGAILVSDLSDTIFYDIDLTDDGGTLTGTITLPGLGDVTVAAVNPCGGVLPACCEGWVPPATIYAHVTSANPILDGLSVPMLPVAPDGGCSVKYTGSAPISGCASCESMFVTLTCCAGVWDNSVSFFDIPCTTTPGTGAKTTVITSCGPFEGTWSNDQFASIGVTCGTASVSGTFSVT